MHAGHRPTSVFGAAILVAALVVLSAAATTVLKQDRFTDNSIASFWRVRTFGNAAVTETNQRLEFSRTGPNGAVSAAGVQFKPYGIDWTQAFHIEWKGRLNLPPITGNPQCFMGTVLYIDGQYPLTMTGVGIGYMRNATGLFFGIVEFTDGAITNFNSTLVTTASTRLVNIDWDPVNDRFIASVTPPGAAIQHYGFTTAYGADYGDLPMTIVQGILMIGGNMTVTGSRAFMDNWEADFVKRNFAP